MQTKINSFQAHPWHGVTPGEDAPKMVNTFIEIVANSTLKYEIDKISGILKIDRPQLYSSLCPTPYGFIPRTYCSKHTAACHNKLPKGVDGDRDPLDICVLTSHEIPHGGFLARAVPIGGLALVDRNEVDDKIIAVLVGDPAYGEISDIKDLPEALLHRLSHYFLSYKAIPGRTKNPIKIHNVYGRTLAQAVIKASIEDYADLVM